MAMMRKTVADMKNKKLSVSIDELQAEVAVVGVLLVVLTVLVLVTVPLQALVSVIVKNKKLSVSIDNYRPR